MLITRRLFEMSEAVTIVRFDLPVKLVLPLRNVFLTYPSNEVLTKPTRHRLHVASKPKLDNARVNRGAATRIEVCLVFGNCRTSVTTSVQRFVSQQPDTASSQF